MCNDWFSFSSILFSYVWLYMALWNFICLFNFGIKIFSPLFSFFSLVIFLIIIMFNLSSSNTQLTSANPPAADRVIKKDEKERRYEQCLPPYYPCNSYVIHFINSLTTEEELKILCNVIKSTTDIIFDTESDIHSHVPSLIQIVLVQEHSSILLVETAHLPNTSSSRFRQIQDLFFHLFRTETNLYSWGSLKDELARFQIYQLFSLPIPSRMFDVQRIFTRWFNEYIHVKYDDKNNTIDYNDSIVIHAPTLDPGLFLPPEMMNCLKLKNNQLWSLQDAIAYLFYKYLSKRDTLRSWSIGLDKRLSSRNKNYSLNYRKRLIQYASYDCLSVMEIILFMYENYLSDLHDKDLHIQSLGEYFFYLTTKFAPSTSSFRLVNNSQLYEMLFDDESDESMTGHELYDRHQISSEAQTDEPYLNISLHPVELEPSEQTDPIQQEIDYDISIDQYLTTEPQSNNFEYYIEINSPEAQTDEQYSNISLHLVEPEPSEQIDPIQQEEPQSNNYEYYIEINASEESNCYHQMNHHQEFEMNYHVPTNNVDVIPGYSKETKLKQVKSEAAIKRRNQNSSIRHRRNRYNFFIMRQVNTNITNVKRILRSYAVPYININIVKSKLYIGVISHDFMDYFNQLLPMDLFI